MLVLAAWPRLEPSAMHVKAVVEQPIFVKPLVAIAKRTAPAITALPIDKVAINKLATALREQSVDRQPVGSLGAALAIPIDEGRKLCAEGLAAFAIGLGAIVALTRWIGSPSDATADHHGGGDQP